MIFSSTDSTSQLPPPGTTTFDHILPPSTRSPHNPSSPAFIDGITGRTITRHALRRDALRLSYTLHKHSLSRPDANAREPVIMIFSPNSMDYPILFLGAQAAGCIASLVNASYMTDELAHQIRDSTPFIIFVHPTLVDILELALTLLKAEGYEVGRVKVYSASSEAIRSVNSDTTYPSYQTLYVEDRDLEDDAPAPAYKGFNLSKEEIDNTPALLCYSSGTTGRSKGVITTNKNFTYLSAGWSSHMNGYEARSGGGRGGDVYISVLPFYHIYGLLQVVIAPLVEGIPAVILPRFLPETFLTAVSRYRVTLAMVVPPILLMLATHPLVAKHDLSSLQMFMSAAAPLGQGLTNQVLDRLKKQGGAAAKNLKITQAYGLTETSGASVSLRLEFVESKAGSVGRPWATFQYKVIGEEGEDLKAGETGELCMRGPGIMQGYWRNKKATEETFIPGPERWFKTGDSVRIDEDGFIFIVDRIKELIKYKGFQVAPADLEALLLTHPKVDDVSVIGIFSEEHATELPRAYVVLNKDVAGQDQGAVSQEIADWVATQVAAHKRLRGGVIPIDAIPKSAAGKILRRQLRLLSDAKPSTMSTPNSGKGKL